MPETVIIAGGGASGALLALELVRQSSDVEVVIVEPRKRLGTGIAYSTDCPAHLLNVPAASISPFENEPDHFVAWLQARYPAVYDGRSFVPRSIYGTYLCETVAEGRVQAGTRWQHVRATACDAAVDNAGVRVVLSDGQTLRGDALVVATGNAAPAAWPGIPHGPGAERFFDSAWDAHALIPDDPNETVLLLGTGLTTVDAVLGLRHNGHRGPIYMVSRRGLLPHEHRLFDTPPQACPDAQSMRDLSDVTRVLGRETGATAENWRASIDRIRPQVNALWQTQALADQRRFVRHLMPYWNAHRHRMAPDVAKRIADLMVADTLRMLAGRTGEIQAADGVLRVPIKLRSEETTILIEAGRVINCSGPEHDFRKLPNALIRSLLSGGLMTSSALGIGVAIAPDGALLDADGAPSRRIFAIGPVRYGTLIETTAIPEIRAQAHDLARSLARGIALPSDKSTSIAFRHA